MNLFAGHVFAFGESRALAIANMVLGLKEIQIRGEIRTNVDYTIDLLNVSLYSGLLFPFNFFGLCSLYFMDICQAFHANSFVFHAGF